MSDTSPAMRDSVEFLLRSLRDLEAEHAAGDIDDADYEALKDDYTARAAAALRSSSEPPPEPEPEPEPEPRPSTAGAPPTRRRWRRPLILAIAIPVVAAGIVLAIIAATSTRTPGETITGAQLGKNKLGQLLASAQQASDKGDALSAIKDYEQILRTNPDQVDALTDEGWLLVQTGQASLVNRGLALLQTAERIAPTYVPAHLYRGVALIAQGQDRAAIPDLQYYLAHNPDPALKARVQQALSQAEAAVARPPTPSTTAP